MFPQGSNDQERLAKYLGAHPRLEVAPVPVPVDRSLAVRFIADEAPRASSLASFRKLVKLAVFYDLRETAPTFGGLLTQNERDSSAIARSALALIALAWIGDQRQWEYAQRYYRALTDRANPEKDRKELLAVCDALGTREGTAYHRQWVSARLARLQQELQSSRERKSPVPEAAVENRINELREHLAFAVTRVDQANNIRGRLEGMTPDGRVPGLTALYLEDPDIAGITREMSDWAGLTLIRLAYQMSGLRNTIGLEMVKSAQKFAGKDGARREEFDVLRARALRAAEFFGTALDQPAREWLSAQRDTGKDTLALRPNWKYGASRRAALQ